MEIVSWHDARPVWLAQPKNERSDIVQVWDSERREPNYLSSCAVVHESRIARQDERPDGNQRSSGNVTSPIAGIEHGCRERIGFESDRRSDSVQAQRPVVDKKAHVTGVIRHDIEQVRHRARNRKCAHRAHVNHERQGVRVLSEVHLEPHVHGAPSEINGWHEMRPNVHRFVCHLEHAEYAVFQRTVRMTITGKNEGLAKVLRHFIPAERFHFFAVVCHIGHANHCM